MGATFPMGIDSNTLTEDEINAFLKITSEKSLKEIARETEKLAGENMSGGRMIRGDMKISQKEIEDFMIEISQHKVPKVTKADMKKYLSAFPQKNAAANANLTEKQLAAQLAEDAKIKKQEVNFLLNGQAEMEAADLFELLAKTQIEEFDPVEEAFKLLDVDSQGYLTVETFKQIFEKLDLGTIEKNDEEIFREVADFDQDGLISLEDFRKILTYNPGEDEEEQELI